MPGSEGLERWNEVDIPDDMPVSRILRDYVGQVCGFDGFTVTDPSPRRRHQSTSPMEGLLSWFARHPKKIEDNEVDAVIVVFESLAETVRQRRQGTEAG